MLWQSIAALPWERAEAHARAKATEEVADLQAVAIMGPKRLRAVVVRESVAGKHSEGLW